MKIGILSAFNGSDSAYSLVNVVAVQLRMLLEAGYRPVLFVGMNFTGSGIWADKRIDLRRCTVECLPDACQDIDVMLCHDIVFLGQHAAWGEQVRKLAAARPQLAWLHWQHSRGDPQVEPCDNSWYCYPNQGDLEHVAWLNQTTLDRVRYVPHALDFDYLGWPKLAIQIATDCEFPFVDVAVLLPTRMDRQKQVERVVRIMAGLKRAGLSVCLLVADAMATGDQFIEYKEELHTLAGELDLTDREVVFLSEQYQECHTGTPRKVVKALLEMSNLFIQPSNAETSSLVVLEAALAGALPIINEDFPPIHHLYQSAARLPFGSILHDTTYWHDEILPDGTIRKTEDNQLFWDDQARDLIKPMLEDQIAAQVRRQQFKERWPSKVFSDYLEPIILEVYRAQRSVVEVLPTGDPDVTAIVTTMDNLPLLRRQIPILIEECRHVIIVNNESVDGTGDWLNNHQWSNVTVIHRPNEGAGKGRNAGLAEWDKHPTPFTLMLDGGILPIPGGVAAMKDWLIRHPDMSVIAPEVVGYGDSDQSCFVDDEADATQVMPPIEEGMTFVQTCLSGTAYALCRADAWRVRFSEEGPFGVAGWGCDDNEMQYRWNNAGIIHHDFKIETGIRVYRRGSGSFQRLYKETGIWPNQFGSVYEQRNVKMSQDWRQYYDPVYGKYADIEVSFVLEGLLYPQLAVTVKRLHDEYKDVAHEVIVDIESLGGATHDDTFRWLDLFALRWPYGNKTVDRVTGQIVIRTPRNETIWTGDVMINRTPRGKRVEVITTDVLVGGSGLEVESIELNHS